MPEYIRPACVYILWKIGARQTLWEGRHHNPIVGGCFHCCAKRQATNTIGRSVLLVIARIKILIVASEMNAHIKCLAVLVFTIAGNKRQMILFNCCRPWNPPTPSNSMSSSDLFSLMVAKYVWIAAACLHWSVYIPRQSGAVVRTEKLYFCQFKVFRCSRVYFNFIFPAHSCHHSDHHCQQMGPVGSNRRSIAEEYLQQQSNRSQNKPLCSAVSRRNGWKKHQL